MFIRRCNKVVMPTTPGWRRHTPISSKTTRCGTSFRTWRETLACRATTTSAKALPQKPCTMERPECENASEFKLSPDYYKGDSSMRESGFDVSFRFGPFGAGTHHYAAVCLNS